MRHLSLLCLMAVLGLFFMFFSSNGFHMQVSSGQGFGPVGFIIFHQTFVPQTTTSMFSITPVPPASFTAFLGSPVFQPRPVFFSFGFAGQ